MLSRRNLLVGASYLALMAPLRSARFPRGSIPNIFKNGRSQVNLDFLQGGGEFPFINHIKTAPAWGWADNSGVDTITPNLLNGDGYPLATPSHTGLTTLFFIPTRAEYATDWVLEWDGNGTVIFQGNGGFTTVSGSATSSPWRVTPDPSTTTLTVGISVVGSPIITNMRCYPFAEQTAFHGGAIFSAKFKARLTQANFGVIRFMNWLQAATGGNNTTTWDTANRPTTYFMYQGGQLRSDLLCNSAGSGITTNSGCDYTVSAPSTWTTSAGKPSDKSVVHLVFNATSSQILVTNTGNNVNWTAHGLQVGNQVAFTVPGTSGSGNTTPVISNFVYPYAQIYWVTSVTADTFTVSTSPGGTTATLASLSAFCRMIPTVNVGATGAITVLDVGAQPLGSDGLPVGGDQGSLATMVYDAQLGVWLKEGGVTNNPGSLQNGVPYSVMIELCNQVGAHPWFTAPSFTCTPVTDFWTQLPTLVKNTGPSWMIPRFEGPNECWAGNLICEYPNAITTSYGWGADQNNWYGKAISLIGQAVNAVYGGTPATQTAYQVHCGVQTTSFNSISNANGSDVRLTSAQYVATQSGSAASNWVSHVCGANYFQPSIYGRNDELRLAFAYAVTNAGNSAAQAANAATYEAHNNDGLTVSSFTNGSPGIINFAAPHGLALGQIVGGFTTGAMPAIGGTWWVNTIPTSTSITVSSTDPNNGGATPITFSGSAVGTTVIVPNNSFSIPAVNVFFQNIASWAAGKNVNIKTACYEGGYSPDYSSAAIYGKITGGTNTTNCVLTIPVIVFQDIHSPAEQQNTTNSGIVVGMRLLLSGMPASGGWSAFENQVATVTAVSGTSVTTSFNASTAKNSLATALAGSFVFGSIQDAGSISGVVWLNALRYAGKSAPNLQANMTAMYNDISTIFPSMFQLGGSLTCFDGARGGTYPSSNSWSVLEDIYQSPDPPQWLAAIAFNH
jgi:hypothetical protein